MSWRTKKPDDWSTYQYESLKTISLMSWQVKRIADAIDSYDLQRQHEQLEAIIQSCIQEMVTVINKNKGYYDGTQGKDQGHYTGHYSG